MIDYKRYGDEKPKAGKLCWIKTHRSKSARLGEWERSWAGNPMGWWRWINGLLGPACHSDDLWQYAVPPELPKEAK